MTSPHDTPRAPRPTNVLLRSLAGLAAALLLAAGCVHRTSNPATAPADWTAWRAERRESIAGTNGWITLAGRTWLDEGANTAGSAPTNHAVLPRERAAGWIGTFVRSGKTVRFVSAPGIVARLGNNDVQEAVLRSDADGTPDRLRIGPLVLTIIQRGEKVGLRVRDPESPARNAFAGLDYFPYDPRWRLDARFEPFTEPRTLRVDDVTGNTQTLPSPGHLVFEVGGKEHRVQVAAEPGDDRYFLMFRDATTGRTTYSAGRFLYVDPADATGRVVLDFNRAFTPPCGFTAYATCPLPPAGNRLPFAIAAGERAPRGPHPVP